MPRQLNDSALSILSPNDKRLFVRFGLGDAREPPFRCVHHAFEHNARLYPDDIAVEHLSSSITYASLDRKSNALAHRLRELGVYPGRRVCLLVQRSISMVIGILAILKAGAAYVPLDGGIVTQSTLEFIIEDSESVLVLAMEEFAHRVSHIPDLPVLALEPAIEDSDARYSTRIIDLSTPKDGVYVIYTSGMRGCSNCR